MEEAVKRLEVRGYVRRHKRVEGIEKIKAEGPIEKVNTAAGRKQRRRGISFRGYLETNDGMLARGTAVLSQMAGREAAW